MVDDIQHWEVLHRWGTVQHMDFGGQGSPGCRVGPSGSLALLRLCKHIRFLQSNPRYGGYF